MENMDKELTVPKWVLIVRPTTPQMPQKSSAQKVCPSPKVRIFWKKLSLSVRSPWMKQVQIKFKPTTRAARFFNFKYKFSKGNNIWWKSKELWNLKKHCWLCLEINYQENNMKEKLLNNIIKACLLY